MSQKWCKFGYFPLLGARMLMLCVLNELVTIPTRFADSGDKSEAKSRQTQKNSELSVPLLLHKPKTVKFDLESRV